MNTAQENNDKMRIYEVGYLIIPSIPEEKLGTEVDKLVDFIKSKGAILSEEFPKRRALSYTMIKKIGTTNHRFKEGYFGWIKFEMSQDVINDLKVSLETNTNILRSLLISTVRESTYLGEKAKILVKELGGKDENEKDTTEAPVKVEKHEEVNPEEIDKSIDDMVKNTN